MDLQGIMLREKVRQRKTNMTSFHLQVQHKKQTKQKRNRLIDIEKLVVTRGRKKRCGQNR